MSDRPGNYLRIYIERGQGTHTIATVPSGFSLLATGLILSATGTTLVTFQSGTDPLLKVSLAANAPFSAGNDPHGWIRTPSGALSLVVSANVTVYGVLTGRLVPLHVET